MRGLFGIFLFFQIATFPLFSQTAISSARRSFGDIFPNLSSSTREAAFSDEGYFKSYNKVSSLAILGSGPGAIDSRITDAVLNKKPGFLVESILVIPGRADEYSLLNVYNALGKIRGLKGRLYHSFTRDRDIPLFEDVTRIESAKKNVPVDDPAPAFRVPSSETIYMRLKDVNFGNSFYRGEMALEQRGLRYSMTNFKSLTYLLIPVIKEERFTVQLYFELISEGVLIYALSGADVSDFVSSRVDMASAISKRLEVIIDWIAEGITGGY